MSVNQLPAGVVRGVPANMNQMQQYTIYQQQQQQAELDQKKLQDMIDALGLMANIRDDMNIILDNVGKMNTANNYTSLLLLTKSKSSESDLTSDKKVTATAVQVAPTAVATPSSVSNLNTQVQSVHQVEQQQEEAPGLPPSDSCGGDDQFNLDMQQQQFFEHTDSKYLQDKSIEINKNLMYVKKVAFLYIILAAFLNGATI